jgi:hypothetical protein
VLILGRAVALPAATTDRAASAHGRTRRNWATSRSVPAR